jgi:type 1 glutamine amidotransferase
MSKQALIVWGGWEGHQPEAVARILRDALVAHGVRVQSVDSLDVLADEDRVRSMDVVVPIWTMGKITTEQLAGLCRAVRAGTGIAGCHGGMCDSFREATEYQFMTGGQWVAHPGNDGVEYRVRITDRSHFITEGLSDYTVVSEQYYMHVDPSNHVLATTRFPVEDVDGPHVPNGPFDMPVAWTRRYGEGRVFYHSVGHNAAAVSQPETLRFITRGLLWAARLDVPGPENGA